LYKVTDANNTVDIASAEVTSLNFPENSYLSSVSINPDNVDHVLITFSNYGIPSIFESTDGGQSFDDVSGNLEQFPDGTGNGPSVRWGELIPTTSGFLYLVGTSTGLYSTSVTNGTSTTWVKESSSLIGSAVVTMMDYRPIDGRLAIATHGNGVFSSTISDFKRIEVPQEDTDFRITKAFPNPFNESTRIEFTIPEAGNVRINLYTRQGELIKTLLWYHQFAGTNSIIWDGKNSTGTPVANGIYLYNVEYNGSIKGGKIALRR
jgi:hypothetical protein